MDFDEASTMGSAIKSFATRWGQHQPQNLTQEMIQYV